ncbi:MAG: putative drug exporter of the superfamily, partial [Thermoleophilaceae bacterium]|nr:putative drug exporter of the superfamily [Thermoleophilaceae bacterium]
MPSTLRPASRFVRLARVCNGHRWRTFAVWVLALVAIQVIASGVGTKQISSFRLPGTESQRAYDLLSKHFPAAKGDSDQLVFKARTGTLRDASNRTRIDAALKQVAGQGPVASVESPFSPRGQLTRDGVIGVATITYRKSTNDYQPATLEKVENAAFTARGAGL